MTATHDLEAEQALLGALLFDNATLERIPALEPGHFYDPVHQRLFAEITARAKRGTVDAVTLKEWSKADAGALELGGHAYLMTLMDRAAPLSAQAVAYAEIITRAASRRRAVHAASGALRALQQGDDPDDVLRALIDADLAAIAAPQEADDLADAGEALLLNLDTPLLKTGLAGLDMRLGGFARGDLIILAGRPAMGKSAVAGQIARNVARRGGVAHFASLEMSKEQMAARAISAASRSSEFGSDHIPYSHIRAGGVDREALAALAAGLPRSMAIDDRGAQTLAQLEQAARTTRRRKGRLDLIVVDYLQLMRAQRKDGRVNEVSEISQGLKALAKALDCPVLALSQLNRAVEGRECKRPTLADLRDSGAIEQDADAVLACYREAYYLEREEPQSLDNSAWADWKVKLDRVLDRRTGWSALDIITLKQRAGETGTDHFDAWLPFDTIKGRAP